MTASPSSDSVKRPPPGATESTQPRKRTRTASSTHSNRLLQLPNELWCLILLFVGSYDLDTLMHLSSLCRIMRQKLQEPLMDYSPSAANQIGQRVASVCLDRSLGIFGELSKKETVLMRRFSVFAIRVSTMDALDMFASAKGGKVASSIRCMTVSSGSSFSTSTERRNEVELDGESVNRPDELLSVLVQFSNVESLRFDEGFGAICARIVSEASSSEKPSVFPNLKNLSAAMSPLKDVIPLIEYYGPQLRYLELNSFPSRKLSVETPWLQKLVLQRTDSLSGIPDSVRHLRICGVKRSTMHQLPDKCQIQTLEIMNCSLSDDFEFPSTLKSLSLYNCSNVPPLGHTKLECFMCAHTSLQKWLKDDFSQLKSLSVLSLGRFPHEGAMNYKVKDFMKITDDAKVLETTLDVLCEAFEASAEFEFLILKSLVHNVFPSEVFSALSNLKEVVFSGTNINIHHLCFLIIYSPNLQYLWLPEKMQFNPISTSGIIPFLTDFLFTCKRSLHNDVIPEPMFQLRRFISAVMCDEDTMDSLAHRNALSLHLLEGFRRDGTFESSFFTPQLYMLLGVVDTFFIKMGYRATQIPTCPNIIVYSSIRGVHQRRREMFSKFMDVESAKFVTEEEKEPFSPYRVASMLS